MFRASPRDGLAWVTGASSGVGRAVALELARRGFKVAATARRDARLEQLAAEATDLEGRVLPYAGDITDPAGIATLFARIEAEQGAVALAFLNAGAAFDEAPGGLDGGALRRSLDLNFQGTVHCLVPLLAAMRARGRGQIAINASLAGYAGLPRGSAYGASKAALIHLAESLRFGLKPAGITIQLVSLGYVRTPLTDGNSHPMPFLMPVDAAAQRICDGFRGGGFEIVLPRRLAWPLKAINHLPYSLYFPLMEWIAGRAKSS